MRFPFIFLRRQFGRAKEALKAESRTGRVVRTALVSLLGRGISIAGTLVTIPLVLNHLGPERYGLWMTLSVIFIYLRLADGGVTVGLISLVSLADGAGDKQRIRQLFSSAFAVTGGVALLLLVLAFQVQFVDWRWLLNLSTPELQAEAAACTMIIIISMAVGYPAAVVRQGRLGLQQGTAANLWDIGAAVITFAGQVAVVFLGLGLIPLAAVTAFTPAIVNMTSSIRFLTGSGQQYAPQARLATWSASRSLFVSGSMFTALTLTQALSIQVDTVLIARMLGVQAVTDYTVVQKMITQPAMMVVMYLIAQFPAYGEALTRGDHAWIGRHFQHTFILAVGFAVVVCSGLALFARPIIRVWIGSTIMPDPILLLSMAIFGVTSTAASVFTYFFFSLGLYRRVLVAYASMIAINIPLAIVLIPFFGSAGASIATTCGYLFTLILPSVFGIRGVLKNLAGLQAKAMARARISDSATI